MIINGDYDFEVSEWESSALEKGTLECRLRWLLDRGIPESVQGFFQFVACYSSCEIVS